LVEKEKELEAVKIQLAHANELISINSSPFQPESVILILIYLFTLTNFFFFQEDLSTTAKAASRLQKSGLTFVQVVIIFSLSFSKKKKKKKNYDPVLRICKIK